MSRVALIHFTAEPCIGGVERVIELQRRILLRHGHAVRVVIGAGGAGEDVVRLAQLMPPPNAATMPVPPADAPDVTEVMNALATATADRDAVWVHNALTVYLNPALTMALLQLAHRRGRQSWTAFCHDLTEESAHWRSLSSLERGALALPSSGITFVADSAVRRSQIALRAGVSESDVKLVPLPIDIASWLGLSPETVEVADKLGLAQADPLLVLPAKLLPHKNVTLAVRVVSALRRLGRAPRIIITGPASPHQPFASSAVLRELLHLVDEQGLDDVVTILGAENNAPTRETVRDLMILADAVLLTSTEEGYGLPLLEAIALRTPILCSDIPSFREIADGYAHFFSLDAPAEQIAALAHEVTAEPAATRRRSILRSMARYEREMLELLEASTLPTPPD